MDAHLAEVQLRRHPLWTIAGAALLFAVVAALGITSSSHDAPLVLFVVPVAVLAVAYGRRGGLAAAVFAIVLVLVVLGPLTHEDVSPLGYLTRSSALAIVGVLVGRYADQRRAAERALERHQQTLEDAVRERTRDLEASRLETLQRLAYAAEYRDYDTHEHTERVGRTAGLLAAELGLSQEEIALIRQAAPLHDVGKLAIADSVLLKPGRLEPAEFELMKKHARVGAEILAGSSSPALQVAEEVALTHHERWDGSGYPSGRKADDIPISGRIVAVADVFDALAHARPYKPAWPISKALSEIRRLAGSSFDPEVVAALDRLDHSLLLAPVEPLARASAS
jgi:HD domain/Domain of unknown function (DUF4118)